MLRSVFNMLAIMLFGVIQCASANERPLAVIASLDAPFDLAPYIEFIEDPDHNMTWEALDAEQYKDQWQPNLEPVFIGRSNRSRYWFRVTMQLPAATQSSALPVLYVSRQPSEIDHLVLRLPNGDMQSRFVRTGNAAPYKHRDIQHAKFAFRLQSNSESITLTGQLDNSEIANLASLPLSVLSAAGHRKLSHQFDMFVLAFYASMGALLVYNACLFFTLRQRLFGLYVLFLLSALLTCAIIDGGTMRWLWPDQPDFNWRMTAVNVVIGPMLYLAFVYSAINPEKFWPKFKRVYQGVLGIGTLIVLYVLQTDKNIEIGQINQTYSGIVLMVTMIVLIAAVRYRVPTSGYLLIAEGMTLAGASIFVLTGHGILPVNWFTGWSLHIGVGGEAFLLSLTLAARTRLAQQAAVKNLADYENLFQQSNDGLFQYHTHDKKLRCNRSFARIFGYQTAAELQQLPADMTELAVDIAQLLKEKGGNMTGVERTIINRQTNKISWVLMSMRLVGKEFDKAQLVDGSMIDITERKLKQLAEHALVDAQKDTIKTQESSIRIKNDFLAAISHELRTPMNAIVGGLQVIQETSHDEQLESLLDIVHSGASDMMRLVDDILTQSEIQSVNLTIKPENFPVRPFVASLRAHYQPLCEEKGLTLQWHVDETVPEWLFADKEKVAIVFTKLLDNAVKFTQQGYVRFNLSRLQDEDLWTLLCVIEDSGVGIAPDDQQQIFKLFTQSETGFQRRFGGLGIGLSICQKVVAMLSGDLSFESTLGKGSCFKVTLPVAPGEAPKVENSKKLSSATLPILVVEDNLVNQKVMQKMLEELGYTSLIVAHGKDALEILNKHSFSLILMDLQMPVMDGFTCTEEIRKRNDGIQQIPIIALTANLMDADKEHCIESGMNDYLKKPVKLVDLQISLSNYIEFARKV